MLSIALLAAVCSESHLMAAQESASAKGFYLGLSGGAAATMGKYTGSGVGSTLNNGVSTATNIATNFGAVGGLFGVVAGYNFQRSSLVLGLDASVGFDTTKKIFYDTTTSGTRSNSYMSALSVKRGLYMSLAPRIGYMVTNDAMIYAKLGVEYSKWQFKVAPSLAQINDAANLNNTTAHYLTSSSKTLTNNKNSISFAPGMGVELYRGKILIRGEYSYLFGPSFKPLQDMRGVNSAAFNGTGMQHSLKTSQHQFKVVVGYKF